MDEVTVLYAKALFAICPKCKERVDGWYGDPCGESEKCDFCQHEFKVSEHADIEFMG